MLRTYMLYFFDPNIMHQVSSKLGQIHTHHGWAMVEVPAHHQKDPVMYKLKFAYMCSMAIKVEIDQMGCVGYIVKDRFNGDTLHQSLSRSSIESITSGALDHFGVLHSIDEVYRRQQLDAARWHQHVFDNDVANMYNHAITLNPVTASQLGIKMDIEKSRPSSFHPDLSLSNLCSEIVRESSGWCVDDLTGPRGVACHPGPTGVAGIQQCDDSNVMASDVSVKLSQLM